MHITQKELEWLPGPINIVDDDRHRSILKMAYDRANSDSPDPSTKNGAILIGAGGSILACGVNKFPAGVVVTPQLLTHKVTKYKFIVHAENNAILNAAKQGDSSHNATMYCPFYACVECAKAIIQSGVKKVIGHAQLMALASDHKTWVQTIIDAWQMLHSARVQCSLYDGVVGTTARFNGEDIKV